MLLTIVVGRMTWVERTEVELAGLIVELALADLRRKSRPAKSCPLHTSLAVDIGRVWSPGLDALQLRVGALICHFASRLLMRVFRTRRQSCLYPYELLVNASQRGEIEVRLRRD